jgi:hypothetical protein
VNPAEQQLERLSVPHWARKIHTDSCFEAIRAV